MKIVLLKTIKNLGKEEEVVEVKPGFARNFLIPKGLAIKVTKSSLGKLQELKQKKTKMIEKEKEEALNLKDKLEGISLTITTQAKEADEIYGSVNQAQILKALKEEGIELPKGKLTLDEPIKKMGVYNLKVNLYPQIQANLRVWVVKK